VKEIKNTRAGNLEAYAALIMLIVYMSLPKFIPGIRDRPTQVIVPLAMVLSGLGLLLSYWGIRFGRGYARIVAKICMVIWLYFTIVPFLVAFVH
jgi:hypothetical protein